MKRLIDSLLIGLAAAVVGYALLAWRSSQASDFHFAWAGARALLAGLNPYHVPVSPYRDIPDPLFYPLPAVLLAVPLVGLPPVLAGAVFVGVSYGLLAYALGDGRRWILLSAPSYFACAQAQWAPLVMALAILLPGLGLVLKPNLALALLRPDRRGLLAAVLVLVASLVVLPSWPLDWLRNLERSHHPAPILVAPVLLLAALINRRLLLLACVPQLLAFYDQLAVGSVLKTGRAALVWSIATWAGVIAWYLGGQHDTPLWAVLTTYGPALVLVATDPVHQRLALRVVVGVEPEADLGNVEARGRAPDRHPDSALGG